MNKVEMILKRQQNESNAIEILKEVIKETNDIDAEKYVKEQLSHVEDAQREGVEVSVADVIQCMAFDVAELKAKLQAARTLLNIAKNK